VKFSINKGDLETMKDDDPERQFYFTGRIEIKKSIPGEKPSKEIARLVLLRALEEGRLHPSAHFKERGQERGFETPDLENVIRSGKVTTAGEYCEEYKNIKYHLVGLVDERELEVVVAIDPSEDYDLCPLIIAITAFWRGRG
jgi:Domain of unknown function (DUF4258)